MNGSELVNVSTCPSADGTLKRFLCVWGVRSACTSYFYLVHKQV